MRRVLVCGLFSLVCLQASPAQAFCRTTNCDPNVSCDKNPSDCCIADGSGCEINGIPVFWASTCVSYNVHKDGSPALGIKADELANIVDLSFESWLSSTCEEGSPSLGMDYRGLAECGHPEFNQAPDDPNANVWMFRDDGDISGYEPQVGMRLDSNTLAVSTLSINSDTAEIYGVDVELNSAIANFTIGDDFIDIDLASVVNHEAGHFLGLDHSSKSGAVMGSGYVPGTVGARTLSEDDREGICAIYPLDRELSGPTSCEPRGEYSPECKSEGCGCKIAGTGTGQQEKGYLLMSLGALALAFARRRYSDVSGLV